MMLRLSAIRGQVLVRLAIWVSLLCAGGGSAGFAAEPADSLDRFLQDLHAFEARFEQLLLDEYGRELDRASGTLYMRLPGQFHWEYLQPYRQRIISDGETLWFHDEDLKQVIIRSVAQLDASVPSLILAGNGELDEHFSRHSLGEMAGHDWIELRPLQEQSQYRSVRIGFLHDTPVMMLMRDNLDQTTRIDFKQGVRNATVPERRFRFSVPPGIDVIDERS